MLTPTTIKCDDFTFKLVLLWVLFRDNCLRSTPFIKKIANRYLGWMPYPCHRPIVANGFTLAELLIALGVLGVIATFTIPKLLSNSEAQQKKAVFKETIGVLSAASRLASESGNTDWRACNVTPYLNGISTYFVDFVFGYDAVSYGIDPTAVALLVNNVRCHAIFANGSYFVGYINQWALIDWNGAKPPNTAGDDILLIELNLSSTPTATPLCRRTVSISGMLQPACGWANAANDALYDSIWK